MSWYSFNSLGYDWKDREKSISFTKVIQDFEEAFTGFLQRLGSAVDRAITDPETKQSLIEILAFENANTECKRVIKPLKADGAPIDEWIRETIGIGPQERHANIIGQIIAGSIMNQNAQCFNCGDI